MPLGSVADEKGLPFGAVPPGAETGGAGSRPVHVWFPRVPRATQGVVAPVAVGPPVAHAAPKASPGGAAVQVAGPDGLGPQDAVRARSATGRVRDVGEEAQGSSPRTATAGAVAVVLARVGRVTATEALAMAVQVAHRARPPDGAPPDGGRQATAVGEVALVAVVRVTAAGARTVTAAAFRGAGDVVADLVRAGPPRITVMV